MGLFVVIRVVLVFSVLTVIHDTDGTRLRMDNGHRSRNGGRRITFPSNREPDNRHNTGRRIYQGPHRDIRRPGGLSYETSDGRDIERKGKALKRREMRHAKRLGKMASKFSERLIRQVFSGKHTQEIAMSPLGIHMAISMASAGARGTTLKELAKGTWVRQSKFGKGNVHKAYFALRDQLILNRPDVDVINAVGLFVKPRIPLEMTFRQTVSQFYNGSFQTLSPTPVKDINDWALRQTNSEIFHLLPTKAVNSNAEMVLASAFCVKGQWETPFNTKKRIFHGNGISKTLDYMDQIAWVRKIEMPHLHLTRFQVILSRGQRKKEGDIILDVVPLNCTATVQDAIGVLTNKTLQKSLQRKTPEPLHFVLPIFHTQTSLAEEDLKSVLKKLRLKKAFRKRKANFEGISSTAGLYLQKFFHKSAIYFNQFGIGCSHPITPTTGLAANSIPKLHNSLFPNKSPSTPMRKEGLPTLRIDRPFVFAIRDTYFGTYLTAGIFAGGKDVHNSENFRGIPLTKSLDLPSTVC